MLFIIIIITHSERVTHWFTPSGTSNSSEYMTYLTFWYKIQHLYKLMLLSLAFATYASFYWLYPKSDIANCMESFRVIKNALYKLELLEPTVLG